jgi:hypothetical protein
MKAELQIRNAAYICCMRGLQQHDSAQASGRPLHRLQMLLDSSSADTSSFCLFAFVTPVSAVEHYPGTCACASTTVHSTVPIHACTRGCQHRVCKACAGQEFGGKLAVRPSTQHHVQHASDICVAHTSLSSLRARSACQEWCVRGTMKELKGAINNFSADIGQLQSLPAGIEQLSRICSAPSHIGRMKIRPPFQIANVAVHAC